MKINRAVKGHPSFSAEVSSLHMELKTILEKCINCKLCQNECEFLRHYGTPREIAEKYDPADETFQSMPFECSLCHLCTAVCPENINPAHMFLEMRRETVNKGNGNYPEHKGILAYERRGTSKRYSWYGLPEGCDTILFPGCTLAGTRPDKTLKLFKYMAQQIPSLGIVFDCCTKPSHDLGKDTYFQAMFSEMKDFLLKHGIKKVYTACPNCHMTFSRYGGELKIETVYEYIARNGFPVQNNIKETVSIHDPCVLRFEESIQSDIRSLILKQGLTIKETPHSGEKTLCCGEGGSVGCLSPEISLKWAELRKKEVNGTMSVTYCAGCANLLNQHKPTSHILDILFEPAAALAGRAQVAKPPMTYLNRLKLKRHLRKTLDTSISRERTFTAHEKSSKAGTFKRISIFFLIIIAIASVHLTGAAQYLEQETLRQLVQDAGAVAPIIYILIYTIATALFLPGLPITVFGGILFGPFWGVVYAITGATMGACLAFLVSRYLAGDWIEAKLKSPKWRRLDRGIERHGWKVVAFTRLIPLFPFNLLNYALGLTKIKFLHYAIATFICMLPAYIAFIVFSSSLLDVLKGKISPAFIAGLLLVILVSLIPFLYNRYKGKKEFKG